VSGDNVAVNFVVRGLR